MEDSEILNRPVSGQPNCHNGIGDSNFTLRRTEIAGCENAANITGDNVSSKTTTSMTSTRPAQLCVGQLTTHRWDPGRGDEQPDHPSQLDRPVGSVTGGGATFGNHHGYRQLLHTEPEHPDRRQLHRRPATPRTRSTRLLPDTRRLHRPQPDVPRRVWVYGVCAGWGSPSQRSTRIETLVPGALISSDNGAVACSN